MADEFGQLRVPRVTTFWGKVDAVMMALKLKDRWNEYQEVSTEEGRVALPNTAFEESTAPYREGDDDVTLHEVDTLIQGSPKPKRKKSKGFCGCCGPKCALFWKAFGIVFVALIGWQTIKLIIWAVTPSPTGLENMPVYSSSLGCLDAQHLYMGDTNTYVVPMDPNRFDHSVDFHGAAVGTLVIAQGKQGSNEVRFKMSVRTDDEDLLSEVSVTYPPHEEIESGKAHSRIQLSTPPSLGSSCMRYDATLYIPPNLKKLHIQAHSIAHIRFDDSAQIDLEKLFITLYTTNKNNMILPNAGIRANEMSLEMIRGWLVGELNLVNSTVISTQRGDATTNLRVLPISTGYDPIPAVFESITGAGRTDLFYITDHGAPHRPIDSTHRSSRNGNLYLTYKDAEFSGQVKLKVKSYTAFGLQGSVNGPNKDIEPPWYGDKNGKDRLNIQSVNGWVGLYFQ